MATLLIGYDLNRPGQDYEDLFEVLKSERAWWHHLDSTWLVVTSKTPSEMRDELKKHVDSNDEVLVIDVTGREAAWCGFSEKAKAWIKKNL